MPELPPYTLAAGLAPLLVVALELAVLRTGLFRTTRYWLTAGIVLGFQVPVDGWLTKPQGTVVHYHPAAILGVRAPGWFPVEDFGFGFAVVTLTLLLWRWYQQRDRRRADPPQPAAASDQPPAGCAAGTGSTG